MNQYTIYCTEKQTKKALELGAPIAIYGKGEMSAEIAKKYNLTPINGVTYIIPTAEQIIGWLEEKHLLKFLTGIDDEDKFFFNVYYAEGYIEVRDYDSRKEATLAAIGAALVTIENDLI